MTDLTIRNEIGTMRNFNHKILKHLWNGSPQLSNHISTFGSNIPWIRHTQTCNSLTYATPHWWWQPFTLERFWFCTKSVPFTIVIISGRCSFCIISELTQPNDHTDYQMTNNLHIVLKISDSNRGSIVSLFNFSYRWSVDSSGKSSYRDVLYGGNAWVPLRIPSSESTPGCCMWRGPSVWPPSQRVIGPVRSPSGVSGHCAPPLGVSALSILASWIFSWPANMESRSYESQSVWMKFNFLRFFATIHHMREKNNSQRVPLAPEPHWLRRR